MKTLLINLPTIVDSFHILSSIPPLGLAELAGYVKKCGQHCDVVDLDVKLNGKRYAHEGKVDLLHCTKCEEELQKTLDNIFSFFDIEKYGLVGFSLTYLDQYPLCFAIANKAKQLNPGIKTVIGGLQVIGKPYSYEFLVKNHFDFLIRSWGELPLTGLIDVLEKEGNDFEKVPGLMYVKDDNVIDNPRGELKIERGNGKVYLFNMYMRDKAIPDFTCFDMEDYAQYFNESNYARTEPCPGNFRIFLLPYRMSIGCTGQCSFCTPQYRQFDVKPVEQVVQELQYLKKTYNCRYFVFMDMHLNISKEYVNDLCDAMIRENLDILWSDCLCTNNLDRDVIAKMRKAGCIKVVLGVESGSDRIRAIMRKGITRAQATEFIAWLHDAGIWITANMIIGFIHETQEDINQNFNFLEENKERIDEISYNELYINEQMDIYRNANAYGISIRSPIMLLDSLKVKYEYDETDGLPWEEKVKQNEYHYKKMGEYIKKTHLNRVQNEWFALYYLYDKFHDKMKVRSFLKSHSKEELGY